MTLEMQEDARRLRWALTELIRNVRDEISKKHGDGVACNAIINAALLICVADAHYEFHELVAGQVDLPRLARTIQRLVDALNEERRALLAMHTGGLN
jgi:hypothetical protein